jgi:sodium/proline symporter
LIFSFMTAYLASQFYAGGKVINVIYPLIPAAAGSFLTAALILSYVTKGGVRASILTDVAQALLMIVVAESCLMYAIAELGGLPAALHRLIVEQPQLLNMGAGRSLYGLMFFVFGFAVVALGFGLGQPSAIVRLVAGKSPAVARNARWIYLTYSYSIWGSMTLFGMLMTIHIPDAADPEQVFPAFAKSDLHPFFSGVAIAGIFSAVASAASAQLLVCSSALAVDISSRLRNWGRQFGIRYQYGMTILVGLIAAVAASISGKLSVYTLVLYVAGALGCAIAPAMLITVLRWRSDAYSLTAAMLAGTAVSVIWNYLGWTASVNEVIPGILLAVVVNFVVTRIRHHRDQL